MPDGAVEVSEVVFRKVLCILSAKRSRDDASKAVQFVYKQLYWFSISIELLGVH
jgi:hypothetical protein